MKTFFLSLVIIAGINTSAQDRLPVGTVLPTRETPVHDPVMIKEKNTYYIFLYRLWYFGFGLQKI
jgi:arabinan endo-1,5-alpha-L-arabinosidase